MGWGDCMKEYIDRLNVAQNHFDWATDPDAVDVAIYELKAAEIAMSRYVRDKRESEIENDSLYTR